jgi:hypothetical protein
VGFTHFFQGDIDLIMKIPPGAPSLGFLIGSAGGSARAPKLIPDSPVLRVHCKLAVILHNTHAEFKQPFLQIIHNVVFFQL